MAKEGKKREAKDKELKTTGHEWDGITEYDTPEPTGFRIVLYLTIFFTLGYWILYPSWPTGDGGLLGWTSEEELERSQEEIEDVQAKYSVKFSKASFEEILEDPMLYKFAIVGGESAFKNNCALCHGQGGTGNPGYPNLTAGAWLWGGKIEDIYQTIRFGIRSSHEDTRDSLMAAFGKDKILTAKEVDELVDYVIAFYSGEKQGQKAASVYRENCAMCHGNRGEGNRDAGAPVLSDAIWLYGNDRKTVYDVIYNGRQGVMPYWEGKLSPATIKQLAVYVHSLGGGE